MKTYPTLLTVAAVLLMSACSTVHLGKEFDLPRFQDYVERGATTRAEVRTWLGEPTATGVSVDNTGQHYEEWIYYYGGGTLPAMNDASLKMLRIKFDEKGTVRSYNWSQNH